MKSRRNQSQESPYTTLTLLLMLGMIVGIALAGVEMDANNASLAWLFGMIAGLCAGALSRLPGSPRQFAVSMRRSESGLPMGSAILTVLTAVVAIFTMALIITVASWMRLDPIGMALLLLAMVGIWWIRTHQDERS